MGGAALAARYGALSSEATELAYWFGHKPARTIVRQGRVVKDVQ